MRSGRLGLFALAAFALAVGCSRPEPPDAADLASADPEVRAAALAAAEASAPALAERLLDDPDPAVAAKALAVLAKVEHYEARRDVVTAYAARGGEPARLAPLIAAWGDEGAMAWRGADTDAARQVATIAGFTDPAQAPTLIRLLGEPATTLRRAAADALHAMGPAALPALDAASGPAAAPIVRANAALIAWRLDPKRPPEQVLGPLFASNEIALADAHDLAALGAACDWMLERVAQGPGVVLRLVAACGEAARPALHAALAGKDRARAAEAAAGMAAHPQPRDLKPLLRAFERLELARQEHMDDQSMVQQEREAMEIDPLPGDKLPDPIPDFEDHGLEQALTEALAAQGPSAVRALLASSDVASDLPPVPIEKVAAIIVAVGRDAVPEALAALPRAVGYEVMVLAEALGEIGDPRAVEPLIKALGRHEDVEQESIAGALAKHGAAFSAACVARAATAGPALRRACVGALERLPGGADATQLAAALDDKDRAVVEAALRVAIARPDKTLGPKLVALLAHRDPEVRRLAAEALGAIGDPADAPALVAAIGSLDGEDPLDVGDLAYAGFEDDLLRFAPHPNAGRMALARIGVAALPPIVAALEAAPRPAVAARLLDALAAIPSEDAAAQRAALKHLEARDLGQRAAAIRAVLALRAPGHLDLLLVGFAAAGKAGARELESHYAMALGRSGAAPAVQALIARADERSAKRGHGPLVVALAQSADPAAREYLRARFEARDLAAIAAAPRHFVQQRRAGDAPTLIAALQHSDDPDFAELLLNTGDDALERAARRWADANNYIVMKGPRIPID